MADSSKNIWIPTIIGIMVNTISFYLFSLQKIDFIKILIIFGTSLILIMIIILQSKIKNLEITTQLKIKHLEEGLENQKSEQKKLNEKLLIHDRLTKLEVILNGKKDDADIILNIIKIILISIIGFILIKAIFF